MESVPVAAAAAAVEEEVVKTPAVDDASATTTNKKQEEDDDDENDDSMGKKRKRAVLFGYSGSGFKGLQSQVGGIVEDNEEDTKPDTVEDALHLALFKAGAIRACNAGSFQKIGWTRSARTDRGVHAASQVIGAKLCVPGTEQPNGGDVSRQEEDAFVAKVNSFLPEQIRVYRILRVANNFNARSATCSRTYGYFLPAFVLQREGATQQELVNELRLILREFVGTHSFHNFTEKLPPRDPRSSRIIHSFTVSEEVMCEGRPMIRLTVRGQSFLKHHIRRMVGFAVECVRRGGGQGVEMTRLSLHPFQVCIPNGNMPMAPAEALFLDSSSFEVYNANVNSNTRTFTDAAAREPIDFENDSTVLRAREQLIHEIILPAIFASGEDSNSSAFQAFEAWLEARKQVDFPPVFAVPDVPAAIVDAQEFLRCVERDRVKRLKLEEYRRTDYGAEKKKL